MNIQDILIICIFLKKTAVPQHLHLVICTTSLINFPGILCSSLRTTYSNAEEQIIYNLYFYVKRNS